jgi:hypothetical protein
VTLSLLNSRCGYFLLNSHGGCNPVRSRGGFNPLRSLGGSISVHGHSVFIPVKKTWWLFSCQIAVVAVILLEAVVAVILLEAVVALFLCNGYSSFVSVYWL